jgi:hypothetical protein
MPSGVLKQIATSPPSGSVTKAIWVGAGKKFRWMNVSIALNSTPKPGCE